MSAVTRGTADEWSVDALHDPDDQPVIEGSATNLQVHQGNGADELFVFTQQRRSDWTVGLPASPSLAVGVTLNAATGGFDLGAGPVSGLGGTFNASDATLDLGDITTPQPADLSLTFNASSGTLSLPAGSMTGSMTLNASSLTICLPADAQARLELESTLASDNLGGSGLSSVGDSWQTEGFDTAASRIDLHITSTVSSLTLERPEVCP